MIRTGVSTFVPKPHTPFQWAEQIGREETERRQGLLLERFRRHRSIHFGRHNPAASFIEGLISRGGRETGDLIEAAWRAGAGYETWEEKLRVDPWLRAVEEIRYDVEAALGPREPGTRLPWDHIDTLVRPEWLAEEWCRAQDLEIRPDCRKGRCNRCGVVEIMPRACGTMIIRSRKGRRQQEENRPDVPGAEPERVTVAPRVSEPIKAEPAAPVARLRFRTGRVGMVRLLSHLESATAWIRALRRAGLPLAYSQGFHAHPKVTFSLASPVGEETEDDPMDVELTGEVDPEAARKALAAVLPAGFSVRSVRPVPLNAPSLMADLAAITYTLMLPIPPDEAWRRVEALLEQDQLMVFRSVKHRSAPGGRAVVPVDLKPLITELAVEATVPSEDRAVLRLRTCSRDGRLVKSREILELLGVDPLRCRVIRRRVDLAAEASDALVSVR